jgi:hypothetical protein
LSHSRCLEGALGLSGGALGAGDSAGTACPQFRAACPRLGAKRAFTVCWWIFCIVNSILNCTKDYSEQGVFCAVHYAVHYPVHSAKDKTKSLLTAPSAAAVQFWLGCRAGMSTELRARVRAEHRTQLGTPMGAGIMRSRCAFSCVVLLVCALKSLGSQCARVHARCHFCGRIEPKPGPRLVIGSPSSAHVQAEAAATAPLRLEGCMPRGSCSTMN